MQAERWKRIEELCQAALEQPPETRAAFLERACPDDAKLRAEVQALLNAQADSFLESAPISAIKGSARAPNWATSRLWSCWAGAGWARSGAPAMRG